MPLVTIENLKFKSAAHHYGFITFIANALLNKKNEVRIFIFSP